MFRDQGLELADQVRVPAVGDVGVDAFLQRDEPQLVQPSALGLHARLVGEVVVCRPAPQRERLVRTILVAQPLELGQVEL